MMRETTIVTGGTGGLGTAVVARLLDDGWRVVVPWVNERELATVEERPGLELVQADLFDPESVAAVVALGAAAGTRPLSGLVNLVGGFAAGGRVHETPIEDFERQFRLNLRATYLMSAAVDPAHARARRRLDRLRRDARGAPAVQRRRRLHLLQGGGHRVCSGARGRVQAGRNPREHDPPERDRHAG